MWAKHDDLWISADNFNQPLESIEYAIWIRFPGFPGAGFWTYKYFYRNSIDRIKLRIVVMCDVTWPGVVDCTNLRIRGISDQNLYTDWETIDQYPNGGVVYDFTHTFSYNDYPDLFDDIRDGTDFIERIQVQLADCDDEDFYGNLYLNIDYGAITYYDDD